MAEIGHIALIIALIVAVYSTVAALIGARRGAGKLIPSIRYSMLTVTGLYTVALALILYSLATKDFSLKIVSEHTTLDLSSLYAMTALYADKAGSIFFWGWLVSLLSALLALQNWNTQKRVKPYALAVLAIIQVFFLMLTAIVANVFAKNPVAPADGLGLNPLLQNFAMFIHPTLLYLGFAGFAVVFAIVIASLLTRSTGTEWIASIRRWALFAWGFLGLGNLIGMWWAYIELGWGGYWAWDPVENAGLMPWLLATAFVHSIAIRRQRHYLQTWSLMLAFFTFVFTLLSPFITHGGIESPLHGFKGSSFPAYILAFILIAVMGSLTLLYFRHRDFGEEKKPLSLISREGAFLLTDIILVTIVFVILAGMVIPRIIEVFGGAKIVLDRSFYDRICGPIMLILVFLMGVCPLLGWSKVQWSSIKRNFLYTLPAALVMAVIVMVTGAGIWYAVAALVGGFPLLTIFLEWFRGTRAWHRNRQENYIRAFLSFLWNRRARYGGFVVHIGIVLITLGIIGSSLYNIEEVATLNINESMRLGKYELTYQGLTLREDKAKIMAIASITVSSGESLIKTMHPEYNYWFKAQSAYSEVAVRTTLAEDVFVSLAWTSFDPQDKSATIRAMINPLIIWIWIGGVLILVGGSVSFSLSGTKLERIKE